MQTPMIDQQAPPVAAEEVVKLLCDLINIPSPTGSEQEVAEFLVDYMRGLGLQARVQEVESGRANAIGVLPGTGGGPALVFNGHLDTATTGRLEEDYAGLGEVVPGNMPHAYIKDGHVYGLGAHNMKGGVAAAASAVGALARSGVKLRGDVIIAAVAGESEKAPVDGALRSFRGPTYRGGGIGTRYYVTHGPVADMAIVCEPSNLLVSNADGGYVWVKLIVKGNAGRLSDQSGQAAVSAITVMSRIVPAIEAWSREYREHHRFDVGLGVMEPRVNIGAVDGGFPYKPAYQPAVCHLYLDIRLTPGMRATDSLDELREVLERLRAEVPQLDYELEVYASNLPSTFTDQKCRVVQTALEVQEQVLGERQGSCASGLFHYWNDTNVFRQHGIQAVRVGPGGDRRKLVSTSQEFDPGQRVAIQELEWAARMYVLAASQLCALSRSEALAD